MGRKKKEPTVVKRYPAALQAEIDEIVREYKEAKQKKKVALNVVGLIKKV